MKSINLLLLTGISLLSLSTFAQTSDGSKSFKLSPDPGYEQSDDKAFGFENQNNSFIGIWCEDIKENMNIATRYIFKEDKTISIFGIFDGIVDVAYGNYELLNGQANYSTYQILASQTANQEVRKYINPDLQLLKISEDRKRIRVFSSKVLESEIRNFDNESEILSKDYNPNNDFYLTPCNKVSGYETEL